MKPTKRAPYSATFLGGAAIALTLAVACSSNQEGFDPTEERPFPEAGTTPVEAAACGLHCSRDLKQVLDGCEGAETVIEVCNSEMGCGDGKCVPACTAAALSKGSAGCDFWTLPPDEAGNYIGSCFAAMVSNTWDRPVTISAEYGTEALDISRSTYTVEQVDGDPVYKLLEGPLPVGQVAIVFLADDVDSQIGGYHCPVSVKAALEEDPIAHGTTKTKAFHVKTDAPIAAYSVYPYGGAESHMPAATLLLPVTAWDKNYVAISPDDFGESVSPRTLQIVAAEDETEVVIRPTVNITGSDSVSGTTKGTPQKWTLSRGQVLQFTQRAMTGSPIETNKPVGVFGGSVCTDLIAGTCDLLGQQIAPFSEWGTQYVMAPFKSRIETMQGGFREIVPYSLVGAVDGTVLEYSPSKPKGAPDKLDAGVSVTFTTDELFMVKSQDSKHPFYASVYMTGAMYGSGTGRETLGDPDFVNIPPTDQYLDHYVFFTDYTYPDTSLTIVRKKTAGGFKPVILECAGELTGFQPLGTDGEYELAWVTLTQGYLPQSFAKGQCGYGRQEAVSEAPFSITVWGVGIAASYGYVAGTGVRPINDAPPPRVN
jgi:IgGFc binding protein